jgi:hypothetical protein
VKDTFAPVGLLGALVAQLPDLKAPGGEGDFAVSPSLFFVLFGIGFVVGVAGSLFKSRTLVASGIGIVFVSTGLFVVLSLEANQ